MTTWMCMCGLWNILKMSTYAHSFAKQEKNKTKYLPFTIGIQTLLQIVWLLEFRHNGALSMYATFGTNVQRYHLFTLMVFDHHHQGFPITWVITSQQIKLDIIQWLLALKECTLKEDPTWKPSCFIVDDALQEHHVIKYNTQFTYIVPFCFV